MILSRTQYAAVAWFAVAWTLFVVLLGAWVRLHDAGLGCPDWPGCFGQVTWPKEAHEITAAEQQFPGVTVETHKASKEMIHRYPAGIILILSLFLTWAAFRRRKQDPEQPLKLPMAITLLVIVQALFGMWTVTFKLMPIVVTTHLLGGFATLTLLFILARRMRPKPAPVPRAGVAVRRVTLLALLLLISQIFLGGWTSTNYAALACSEFPTCQGELWPHMDGSDAFTLFREIGVDYEGGILDFDARVAIHMVHRVGALVVSIWFVALGLMLLWSGLTRYGLLILAGLGLQLTLGIMNVLYSLPLHVAVAHNGGAALLLLITVATLMRVWHSGRTHESHT